jgi:hypothetical protein
MWTHEDNHQSTTSNLEESLSIIARHLSCHLAVEFRNFEDHKMYVYETAALLGSNSLVAVFQCFEYF